MFSVTHCLCITIKVYSDLHKTWSRADDQISVQFVQFLSIITCYSQDFLIAASLHSVNSTHCQSAVCAGCLTDYIITLWWRSSDNFVDKKVVSWAELDKTGAVEDTGDTVLKY